MEPNARLLILGGIHGGEDGKLGEVDQNIENDTLHQIEMLKEERKDEIEDFNTTIIYECVGDYLDKESWKPKPDELAKAILKHQPTMLLLAFCYTSQSILNDTLRSQGIYSLLIMQKERETFTHSRCIFLDDAQKSALLRIAQTRPQLVMLLGNFGTGKTVLLMEALRIKISQYQEARKKVKVIVTSDSKQKALIEFLKNNYELENVDIEFYECLKDIPVKDDIGLVGQVVSITDLNNCVNRIAKSTNKKVLFMELLERLILSEIARTERMTKVILVIDEYFVKGKQDWDQFETHPDVDVLIAFHPRKESRIPFILPSNDKRGVLCCTLDTMYRNSYEVLRLCSFISSHAKQFSQSASVKTYPIVPPEENQCERLKNMLPVGETPVWIELEFDLVHPVTLFNYIKFKFLKKSRNVTFIINDSHTHSEDVKNWLLQNNYQQHTSSEFAQVASSFQHSMRGIEDDVSTTIKRVFYAYSSNIY